VARSIDDIVRQAMNENMLLEIYRPFVMDFLHRRDDVWRQCCNSDCDPCVLQLARVVDRARQLMAEDGITR
jgi:hypothetical protein